MLNIGRDSRRPVICEAAEVDIPSQLLFPEGPGMLSKANRAKKEEPVVVPSGRSPDGKSFFRVKEIKYGGRHKIALLPVGACLLIEPGCLLNDQFGTFDGPPV